MKSKTKEAQRYRLARLSDTNDDLTKQWVVVYYIWSKARQKLVRCRVIIKGDTVQERKRDAAKVIKDVNQELKAGAVYNDNPGAEEPQVEKTPSKVEEIDSRSQLSDAIDYFLLIKKRSLKANSHKTYRSSLKIFVTYLNEKGLARTRLNQFSIGQAPG